MPSEIRLDMIFPLVLYGRAPTIWQRHGFSPAGVRRWKWAKPPLKEFKQASKEKTKNKSGRDNTKLYKHMVNEAWEQLLIKTWDRLHYFEYKLNHFQKKTKNQCLPRPLLIRSFWLCWDIFKLEKSFFHTSTKSNRNALSKIFLDNPNFV